MSILSIVVISVLTGAGGATLIWIIVSLTRRIVALEARVAQEDSRKEALANCKGKRHYSHNQVAAIWDAMAVIIGARSDNEAERARMDTALSILNTLYNNPQSYDPERPSGPRA